MKVAWVKGLNAEQKAEMEREYSATALLRSRLAFMIQEKIKSNRTTQTSKSEYENASWAYKQADAIGYERALEEILSNIS